MYNHAPEHYVCPFCLLVQGIENTFVQSVQSDIVFHDGVVTAFISSHQWPNNHGNVIIVPNEHFENIYDLPVPYAIDIQKAARMIAFVMKAVYSCDGISTRQHNEPGGNQDVWHYHVHVTPRYRDDRFYTTQRELMAVSERARHAERLIGQTHLTFGRYSSPLKSLPRALAVVSGAAQRQVLDQWRCAALVSFPNAFALERLKSYLAEQNGMH